MSVIDMFFAGFEWYRRRKGGRWYKVWYPEWQTGTAGSVMAWVRELPTKEEYEILEEENHGQ